MRLALAALATTAIVASPLLAPPAPASAAPATETVIQRILDDTNVLRSEAGLPPLVRNASLDTVARNWSQSQANSNAMSHNPSFSAQYPSGWSRAGENVAYGYSYTAVVGKWADSAGHYANIVGDYTDIGIGVAYSSSTGQAYYTQNFAKYRTTAVPPVVNPTADPSNSPTVPIYRFWSPRNSTHFFTANAAERDSIIANYPPSIWTYEGVAYRAFTTKVAGSVPLFRFWSPRLSGHFFTSNQSERNQIIATYPTSTWTYEGVAYYVYPNNVSGATTVPVSRFWSPKNQHHFFTSNASESASVRANYPAYIWTYEGDNFRVPTW